MSHSSSPLHAHFLGLAQQLDVRMGPAEDYTLWLRAEESDFVRFNQGKVRQPGSVSQRELTLRLIQGRRHCSTEFSLSGVASEDLVRVESALARLRERIAHLPEDPLLLWETAGHSGVHLCTEALPDGTEMTEAILEEVALAGGLDLVGILASGPIYSGFASSRGQRCWDERQSWLLDWCLYQQGDKAVKSSVGGTQWDRSLLAQRMAEARQVLPVLARPARRLDPGRYRAWLTPSALGEVMSLLSWGAFSHRAQEARNTPLLSMITQGRALDPRVSLAENLAGGLQPGFSHDGFARPEQVSLIEAGKLVGSLVCPRSSLEYNRPHNGASGDESPTALNMKPGELPTGSELAALGTGLWLSNLWYLNYSDQPAGRITGMTRFASCWVENGEVVAPAEVMRFDETIFHLLGEGLETIGDQQSMMPDSSTYERRATGSQRLPGILVDGMRFTL